MLCGGSEASYGTCAISWDCMSGYKGLGLGFLKSQDGMARSLRSAWRADMSVMLTGAPAACARCAAVRLSG